jgi:hypothetical protein
VLARRGVVWALIRVGYLIAIDERRRALPFASLCGSPIGPPILSWRGYVMIALVAVCIAACIAGSVYLSLSM